jgi:hypothetical protein
VRIEERPHVVGPGTQGVDDVIGPLGGTEADDVGGEHVKLLGQRRNVVLPVSRSGHTWTRAVQHDDRWTGAGFEIAGFDASGINAPWFH